MEAKILQTVSLLFLWVWLPLAVSSSQKYHRLELPTGAVGPESLAFDCRGKGPYTGVADGRILKYQGPKRGWRNFAYTSPLRRRSLEYSEIVRTHDKSGRFMKYDLRTKQVTVLLRGLVFANGVAVSKDKKYAIVCEDMKGEILRYWLRGPKAHTSEFFARPPGNPDNININADGDFWVALGGNNITAGEPIGVRLGGDGQILQRLLGDGILGSVSEVEERNGLLLVGTVATTYIGITSL
ncbi:hypothetical protein ACHQM5_007089 [Ranunculus cassubicifolius]